MLGKRYPVWTVEYRCIWRDHWYEDSEWPTYGMAVYRALEIQQLEPKRAVRVLDAEGQIVWYRGPE